MFYPQGNFYPQGIYPQGNFGPQPFQNNPFQGGFAIQSGFGNTPFSNSLYGYPQQAYPQQPQSFAQNLPQPSFWQNPAQHPAALQHAMQQLLAHQLAAQQPAGMAQFSGLSNGSAQSGAWTQQPGAWTQQPGAWTQQQPNPEQFSAGLIQGHHHLLQQLAQYHYLVAQQLAQQLAQLAAQLAAQQTVHGGSLTPFAGQFIPGQLGANYVPGLTMH